MTWSRMFTALLSKIKTQDGYRYIEHIGGCQRTGLGEWAKIGERGQKVQTSGFN